MRLVEWVLGSYFFYTSLLALTLPITPEVRLRTLVVNGIVASIFAVLLGPARWRDAAWMQVTRDHYALALVLLAYKQMGWFAPAVHDYHLERSWIRWDHIVLDGWGLKHGIELLGPIIPTLLELSYLLVYAVGPVCVWLLYGFMRRAEVSTFLFIYILGLFLAYVQFPFWPSEPPRTVFPGDLEPLTNAMRRVNLAVLGNAGIHTSVFPSAHVSGSFAAAFAFWRQFRDKRWLRYGMIIYAVLIAFATVYGRYHYAVDAAAGFVVAIIGTYVAHWLMRRRQHSLSPEFVSESAYPEQPATT